MMKRLEMLQKQSYIDGGAWLRLLLTVSILTLLYPAVPSLAQPHQGFGADTPGGEGKPVYRVTNLNDSGPGSLRDAVSQGNRTVAFDVAGELVLASTVPVWGAFITIDGFTAPSPGITLKNYGLSISGARGAHDVVVRGIRVRGAGVATDTEETDGIHVIKGAYNVVIDHVSIHGSEDGNLDIGTGAHDVTVSWSILAEPIESHSTNMLIKYDPSRITLHHNIFIKAKQRNPHVRIDDAGTPATDTTVDMRNNLVRDWAGGVGTQVGYGPWVNVVNNFYSNAGGTLGDQEAALIVCKGECDGGNPASAARAYVSGNYSADGIDLGGEGTETTAFPSPPIDTTDACTAAHRVVSNGGVTPRDIVDQQILSAISLPSCVEANATLAVVPNRLDFSVVSGGANPSPKTLTITDSSGGGLSWTASTSGTWLSVSPASGTTPSAVAVAVNSSGLTEGSHLGSIRTAAPDAENSPLSVPVTLTVLPPTATTPQISTPAPGSVLPGSTVTFTWTPNTANVKKWRLYVGSGRGAKNLYDSGKFSGSLSKTVSGLPTDGRTIWVRLHFEIDGDWQSADFQYTAALN